MDFSDNSSLFASLRAHMVDAQLRARGVKDERVLDAMARVPRHEFAPERYRHQAYDDHPLPIGEGQTISQPYIVALMLEALALSPADRVLEVGTGSGYLTALLAELVARVFSVERHAALAGFAGAPRIHERQGNCGRWYPGICGGCALRCNHRFGRGRRGARRATRPVSRGRANDSTGGYSGFSATAVDPHRRRTAANRVARTVPVCAAGFGHSSGSSSVGSRNKYALSS